FQLRDLAVRRVDLAARGHAELTGHLLHFALHAAAHAHLRVDQAAVDRAELRRQRDFRIRLFRRIDPQIEQGARRGQALAGRAAFAQLLLEDFVRALPGLEHQRVVGAGLLLVVDLRLRQLLPALLVLARETERRHAQPRRGLALPRI